MRVSDADGVEAPIRVAFVADSISVRRLLPVACRPTYQAFFAARDTYAIQPSSPKTNVTGAFTRPRLKADIRGIRVGSACSSLTVLAAVSRGFFCPLPCGDQVREGGRAARAGSGRSVAAFDLPHPRVETRIALHRAMDGVEFR